jgi:hypothetical protein
MGQAKTIIQSGTVATRTAAKPEGSVVSPTVTPPLPAKSSRMPMTAPASQALAPGLALSWAVAWLPDAARRAMGYSSAPAITYRVPANNSGGRCPTPTRIAR